MLSKKRQRELQKDAEMVRFIYDEACKRFGHDVVRRDLIRLWDMRCILGIQKVIPFLSMEARNLKEFMFVATEICGYHENMKEEMTR